MIKEIAFTAYRVTDMARARRFYEEHPGLPLALNHQDVWVAYEAGDGTFAIQKSPVCWMATVADPDENPVLPHQRKPGRA